MFAFWGRCWEALRSMRLRAAVMETGCASSSRPIPFTVVGGFLGAGKTSPLNGILEQVEDRRIAVLVNDFGTLRVDASLVSARSARRSA